MKKIALVLLVMTVGVALWAQIPETVGSDYVREAIHYYEDGKDYVNSDVFFRLDAVDYETGLDYIQFALDGGEFMLYKKPFQLLDEGLHEISYRGHDNSRNVEIAKTYPVIVDNTAPKTAISTDVPLYTRGLVRYCSTDTRWYVSATDNAGGAGVAAGYIGTDVDFLEAYGWGEEAEDAYFTLSSEGLASIYYSAIDNVGNLAPINVAGGIIVDSTPPDVFIENSSRLIRRDSEYTVFPSEDFVDDQGRIIVSTSEAVAFGATDDLSGLDAIYVKVNDGEFQKYVEPIQFSSNETYDIQVNAVDNVGNVSETMSYVFYVDKIDPKSELELIDKDGVLLETLTEEDLQNSGSL